MTRFYVNPQGYYIGGFDGTLPPNGSNEISAPPVDARLRWDGLVWVEPDALKDKFYEEKLEKAYVTVGVTDRERLAALWAKVMEGKPTDADALQVKIDDVKAQNPKP